MIRAPHGRWWTTPNARLWLAFGVSLVLVAVWLIAITTSALDWSGDSALYLIHAQNLISGTPYNLSGYIQNPGAYLSPQSYPPGFPMVMAPAVALFGLDIHALKLYVAALLVLTFAVYGLWIRSDLLRYTHAGPLWLVAIGLTAFNPLFLQQLLQLSSDGFFLLTAYAALAAIDHVYRTPEDARFSVRWGMVVAAGLLVALAAATRIFGVLLFAVIPIFELLCYRRLTLRGMTCLAISLVVYALARLGIALDSVPIAQGSAGGYGHLLVDGLWDHALAVPGRVFVSVEQYIYLISQYLVLQWPGEAPRTATTNAQLVVTLACMALSLTGFVIQCLRRLTVREVFFVIYALALLPWLAQSARYLAPLIPLFFFYGMLALAALLAGRQRAVIGVSLLIATLGCAMYTARYDHQLTNPDLSLAEAPNSPAALAMYAYIRGHTPDNSVIAYRKPRILALYTHRQAITYADAMNPMPPDARMLKFLEDNRVDYLLASEHASAPGLETFVDRVKPQRLSRVHQTSYFTLYRVNRDTPGS